VGNVEYSLIDATHQVLKAAMRPEGGPSRKTGRVFFFEQWECFATKSHSTCVRGMLLFPGLV
jgi:hypothetical protein